MDSKYQWNDFEFIPTVKMETRHTIKGYFGGKVQAICSHCRAIGGLKSQDVKNL